MKIIAGVMCYLILSAIVLTGLSNCLLTVFRVLVAISRWIIDLRDRAERKRAERRLEELSGIRQIVANKAETLLKTACETAKNSVSIDVAVLISSGEASQTIQEEKLPKTVKKMLFALLKMALTALLKALLGAAAKALLEAIF